MAAAQRSTMGEQDTALESHRDTGIERSSLRRQRAKCGSRKAGRIQRGLPGAAERILVLTVEQIGHGKIETKGPPLIGRAQIEDRVTGGRGFKTQRVDFGLATDRMKFKPARPLATLMLQGNR